jgi:hypothetical protein
MGWVLPESNAEECLFLPDAQIASTASPLSIPSLDNRAFLCYKLSSQKEQKKLVLTVLSRLGRAGVVCVWHGKVEPPKMKALDALGLLFY